MRQILEDVTVNGLQMGEIEGADDGVFAKLSNSVGYERGFAPFASRFLLVGVGAHAAS
jgi:hypothetical protein